MFRELTIFLNITPWGWETLGALVVLAVVGFVFRMHKIGVARRKRREATARAIDAETNIEPHDVLDRAPIEPSRLEREWALNHDWLSAYWDDEIRRLANGGVAPEDSGRMGLLGGNEFRNRLGERSFSGRTPMTKGQLEDLLGLIEPPDSEQQQILKFFEISGKRKFSKTTAAREIRWIFESKTNCALWGKRPATALQRAFFEHVGVVAPENLNAVDAEAMIKQCIDGFGDKREKCLDDWLALESMCKELGHADIAHHYGMKVPTPQDVLKAFKQLKKEGQEAPSLYIRIDVVAERIRANQPKLRVRRVGKRRSTRGA